MLENLLSAYSPGARIAIALGAAVVLAFLAAEGLARLAKLALNRLTADADPEDSSSLRRVIRVVRTLAFIGMSAVFAVPAIELVGVRTTIDLHPERVLEWVVESGLRILLITTLAWLIIRIVDVAVNRMERRAGAGTGLQAIENAKRIRTLGNLVEYIVGIFVSGAAGLMVLRELNMDITPVLAGAGVAGLAVGFGAQSIVKDFFSGFFLILEDQVRVGDVAAINGVSGLVESITLRKITLRDVEGAVHIFTNGNITTLCNKTKDFSYAVVDASVAYEEDTDRVVDVLREVGRELRNDEQFRAALLDDLEVMGVDQLGASAVVIKTRIKTLPQRQWEIGRELRRRIKKRFDSEGIEIPYPKMSIAASRASASGEPLA